METRTDGGETPKENQQPAEKQSDAAPAPRRPFSLARVPPWAYLLAAGALLAAVVFAAPWGLGRGRGGALVATETPGSPPSAGPASQQVSLPPFRSSSPPDGSVPRRADLHTVIPDRPRIEVAKYAVKEGDTLFGISERFGVKPQTLLWGNFETLQDNPHSLRPGQELNILPVDGTYYQWNEGDSLTRVAEFFDVEPQAIIDWLGNDLPQDMDLDDPPIEPGTWLVIPGGRREFVTWRAPRITRSNPAVAKVSGPGACGSIYSGPVGEGFFIWPTTASFLSGFNFSDYHPGIDIAGSMGNAIYASASGVVVYAGWNNYGYGLMVVIDHGDGWQTLYAHMSQVNVVCGQAVFQGNVIGGVGSTGNSSGPHLHFEMQHDTFGRVNPYNFTSP